MSPMDYMVALVGVVVSLATAALIMNILQGGWPSS